MNMKEMNMKKKMSSLSTYTSAASSVVDKKYYVDMRFLETEEEAAENIADINEKRDVRKKDNKAKTFAPPDDTDTSFEQHTFND